MLDHQNIRVTVDTRQGDKDWAGTGLYLNLRAYRDSTNTALHQYGPDAPAHLGSILSKLPKADAERLVVGLLNLLLLP